MLVLIVDDCASVIELFSIYMEERGHNVISAHFKDASKVFANKKQEIGAVIINADPCFLSEIMGLNEDVREFNSKLPMIFLSDYLNSHTFVEAGIRLDHIMFTNNIWDLIDNTFAGPKKAAA